MDERVVALRGMFPDYDDLILFVRRSLTLPVTRTLTLSGQAICPRVRSLESGSGYRYVAGNERSGIQTPCPTTSGTRPVTGDTSIFVGLGLVPKMNKAHIHPLVVSEPRIALGATQALLHPPQMPTLYVLSTSLRRLVSHYQHDSRPKPSLTNNLQGGLCSRTRSGYNKNGCNASNSNHGQVLVNLRFPIKRVRGGVRNLKTRAQRVPKAKAAVCKRFLSNSTRLPRVSYFPTLDTITRKSAPSCLVVRAQVERRHSVHSFPRSRRRSKSLINLG